MLKSGPSAEPLRAPGACLPLLPAAPQSRLTRSLGRHRLPLWSPGLPTPARPCPDFRCPSLGPNRPVPASVHLHGRKAREQPLCCPCASTPGQEAQLQLPETQWRLAIFQKRESPSTSIGQCPLLQSPKHFKSTQTEQHP